MAEKPSRNNDDESLDYEIVEENEPRRTKRGDDDERPRSRSRDDDDANERRRSRNRANDEVDSRRQDDSDEEEAPRRKRKKKKKKQYVNQSLYDDLENPARIKLEDWIIAGMFFGTGIVLCLIAAVGIAGSAHAWKALLVMFVYFLMLLPVTIGALMGIGIMAGIDYGEYKVAILRLAGISAFNNGLIWMGDWIGLPFYITLMIVALIGLGLFMSLFQLDVQDANITIFAINLVQFAARFILISMALLKARHDERKANRGDDSDYQPQNIKKVDEDFGKKNGPMPPDDDPRDFVPPP